ncbi:dolichyl-diphosphooligosaccharide--protein glycosyltransferase subunit 1 [Oratosquilla oratoria]|uniref:dolichyl-diphosphooligosaccharide--protein glycosyltransferase subunit 1 n=1 Tax=Oratosquilla oratoria TaxID=337810 RepID=UPI003F76AC76
MAKGLYTLVLAMSLVICGATFDSVNKDLVNKKIDRKLDLASQLVKSVNKITLENTGNAGAVKSFLFALSKHERDNLAFFGAQVGSSSLKYSETKVQDHRDVAFFKIELNDALQPGKTVTVEVETIFTQFLEAYPAQIQQGEKQLVKYAGNHYILSPYPTTTQTTSITLASPNIENYSRLKPTTQTDTTITYGPYENVAPFSVDTMTIHYENNSPFLSVTFLERVIEVSHWGNIAVEETLDIRHSGAKLKGAFSRYDYQREHNGYSSVKSFRTVLPASAKDVYYRDEIGNISTSHMKVQEDSVELDLRPRFPLFGGWKTHYKIGYNVPSYEYLYNTDDSYVLKMRFLDHVFDDMAVDEVVVKIILPEGVRNVKLSTPYEVTQDPESMHYTYLDTVGRTTITAKKRNLVENHIQDFELSYQFPSVLMLQEPLLVVLAFFILFFTVIIYVRLDLTLSRDDATEAKMRVSSHCEMVHSHHETRSGQYEKLEEELVRLKGSKDVAQAQAVTKKLLGDIRTESQYITDLAAKIRVDNAEYAEKVTELQKLEKVLRESVTQQVTNVEKLVTNKMSKQQYVDADAQLNKKKEETLEKIKNVLVGI